MVTLKCDAKSRSTETKMDTKVTVNTAIPDCKETLMTRTGLMMSVISTKEVYRNFWTPARPSAS